MARVISVNHTDKDVAKQAPSRKVSILAIESIESVAECPKRGRPGPFSPGDFSEDLTVRGVWLSGLKAGDRLKIGREAVLEVTRIGRECYKYCALYENREDCAITREAVFAKVLKEGMIHAGEEILIDCS